MDSRGFKVVQDFVHPLYGFRITQTIRPEIPSHDRCAAKNKLRLIEAGPDPQVPPLPVVHQRYAPEKWSWAYKCPPRSFSREVRKKGTTSFCSPF